MEICVFASASMTQARYMEAVHTLGYKLGAAGHHLVYGGCDHGLMTAAASGFFEAGAEITGVIPEGFRELPVYSGCTRMIWTPDISTRKTVMEECAQAFVVCPGGIGTLDELFTVLTPKSLGYHHKKVALFSPYGFYDGLMMYLLHMEMEGALAVPSGEMLKCFDKPEALVQWISIEE